MQKWCDLLEEAVAKELADHPSLTDFDRLKRHVVTERTAHKTGVRPGISLEKTSKPVEPLPDGPVNLEDVA